MKESNIKLAIAQYLEYGMNQGKWYSDRLNSGEVIVVGGKSRRRIKLCREGTADFMVLQLNALSDGVHMTLIPACRVIFLEAKSPEGRTRPEQGAFKILVEAQGASYFIIRSIDELQEILGETNPII